MPPESPSLRRFAQRYGGALRTADSSDARAIIQEALESGHSAVEVQSAVIQPAMRWIGDLWADGALTVADEHIATAMTQEILLRLFEPLHFAPRHSRERVVLAAVEGQQHVLGLRMVGDVLEGAGFDVLFLGADVPSESLVQFACEHGPAIVGLGCTLAGSSAYLVHALIDLDRALPGTRVLLGGEGVPPGLRDVGYPWVSSTSDVLEVAENLLARPAPRLPSAIAALGRSSGSRFLGPASRGQHTTAAAQLSKLVESTTQQAREYVRSSRAALGEASGETELSAARRDEVRGPMNAVSGVTHLLLETDLSDEQRELAAFLNTSVGTLRTVVDEILDARPRGHRGSLVATDDVGWPRPADRSPRKTENTEGRGSCRAEPAVEKGALA